MTLLEFADKHPIEVTVSLLLICLTVNQAIYNLSKACSPYTDETEDNEKAVPTVILRKDGKSNFILAYDGVMPDAALARIRADFKNAIEKNTPIVLERGFRVECILEERS